MVGWIGKLRKEKDFLIKDCCSSHNIENIQTRDSKNFGGGWLLCVCVFTEPIVDSRERNFINKKLDQSGLRWVWKNGNWLPFLHLPWLLRLQNYYRSSWRGIHKLRWQARGTMGLAKCRQYYKSLCSKFVHKEGRGSKKSCQRSLWKPP